MTCCVDNCCGPGSYCCQHTAPHTHNRGIRVLVEDEEFGEDFHVRASIGAVIAGLRDAAWDTVYRVPHGDGTIKLPNNGVWLCLRVGDE